jgi:hypothetical protein
LSRGLTKNYKDFIGAKGEAIIGAIRLRVIGAIGIKVLEQKKS